MEEIEAKFSEQSECAEARQRGRNPGQDPFIHKSEATAGTESVGELLAEQRHNGKNALTKPTAPNGNALAIHVPRRTASLINCRLPEREEDKGEDGLIKNMPRRGGEAFNTCGSQRIAKERIPKRIRSGL